VYIRGTWYMKCQDSPKMAPSVGLKRVGRGKTSRRKNSVRTRLAVVSVQRGAFWRAKTLMSLKLAFCTYLPPVCELNGVFLKTEFFLRRKTEQ
jgi:hypothetical protein